MPLQESNLGNNYSVRPTHPESEINLRFNWNAAINIDPNENNTIYFGSQFVHKSIDKGETWSIISPDLTTNNPEKLNQHNSGGLTIDATGAENHCTILVIEPSEIEPEMLWVGTDDGRVHYTQNGGRDWTEVTKNIKYLDTQIKHIIEVYIKKMEKGDNWLIAKKPVNGHTCASCESYIGELPDSNQYVPWNKYPIRDPNDKAYRVINFLFLFYFLDRKWIFKNVTNAEC